MQVEISCCGEKLAQEKQNKKSYRLTEKEQTITDIIPAVAGRYRRAMTFV